MVHSTLLFLNIGGSEMVLILGVALLLFGGDKLPELARGLGKGIRDFKEASEDVKRELNNQINNFEDKKADEKAAETLALPESTNVPNTMPVIDSYVANDELELPAHVEEVHVISNAEAAQHNTIDIAHTEEKHQVANLAAETDYNAIAPADAGEHAKETLSN